MSAREECGVRTVHNLPYMKLWFFISKVSRDYRQLGLATLKKGKSDM